MPKNGHLQIIESLPDPDDIRSRLVANYQEAAILRRLLKVSESAKKSNITMESLT